MVLTINANYLFLMRTWAQNCDLARRVTVVQPGPGPRLYLVIIFIDGIKFCSLISQLYNLVIFNFFKKNCGSPDPQALSTMILWTHTIKMGKSD